MRDLAKEELKSLVARREALIGEMKILLIPKDPNDEKNVMLEIRAGTGGDEAALFAAELFRMYSMFAERHGWRLEVMSSSDTGVGGLKEVIAMIEGRGVYSKLKYESGVHRVQRVPATEASGRIHTSTVTVAVLPGGRGGRRPDQRQGPAHRHLLLERPRRPERQHHLLRRPHHPPPQRRRRLAAGREVADQEPGEGDEGAALAPLRHRDAEAARTRSPRIGAARSARASGRRRSAPTTSATTASPTTACTSRRTGSPKCSTAISPSSSTT